VRLPRFAALTVIVLLAFACSAAAQDSREAVAKAFQALQRGDTDKAGAIFQDALARYPGDPQLLLGVGLVAHLQGQDEKAIPLLKQALKIEPRLSPAAAILGELLYRQGDVDGAIKLYEHAQADAPPDVAPVLRQRLDAWRTEAALPQNHEAVKDDRFSISFDGPAQYELARRAATVLTSAFWRIGKELGTYPSTPINVVLYTTRQFHDITGAPEWSDGEFDGQIRVPVKNASQNLPEFDRVLTHELTHAMLKVVAPRNLPAWLNEGLAMRFEGLDAAALERRLARARLFVPLAALQTSFIRLTAGQAAVAYAESAFAVSALLERIGPGRLAPLFEDLAGGQTIEQAIQRFGFTFAAFESDLARRVGASVQATSR
jgi:tetratricopeptide (TPR) repeat protein